MTLADLALARVQEDLRQVHEEARRQEARLGTPPLALIVEEKAPSSDRWFNTGKVIRRWRVDLGSIVPEPVDSALPAPRLDGMYWDVGRGDFAVLADGRLRIGWVVGPRYGRGFDYPVVSLPDGGHSLGVRAPLWVS